jgi:hypothetical protein
MQLVIEKIIGNPTYTPTRLTKEEILGRKLAIDQFLFKLVCIFYGDLLYKSANQELLYPIEAIFILI